MVVIDIEILRPLILGARGTDPGHVGCLIDAGEFEFRVATSNTFDNGYIKLDTIYATGAFLTDNSQFDANEPRRFDVDSKLALSRCSITGEEFYQAIPSIYGYRDNFSSYMKEVHELPDDDSWGGTAYLIKFEIPENDSNVHDKGYVIHPSILDSIMHSTLAAFIDMDTKSFDFTETLLPVKIDKITRWDKGDNNDLDFHMQGAIWAYLTISTWNPSGPCRSNLIVTNAESLVILTIDGMECAVAPQEQFDMGEGLTTIWQPKAFPAAGFTLPSAEALSTPSYICKVFDALIAKAQAASRHVVRVLDLDTSSLVAKAVGDSLISIPSNQLLVDYFLAGVSPEDADEKARALSYPRARPFVLDPENAEGVDAKTQAMSRAKTFNLDPTQATPEEAEAIARAMALARQAELDPNSGEYAMVFGR
jgi:Polyketide synthase dehydratase